MKNLKQLNLVVMRKIQVKFWENAGGKKKKKARVVSRNNPAEGRRVIETLQQ